MDGSKSEDSDDNLSCLAQADKLEATFQAVQDKFDVMTKLEMHGDINDPVYLRSELHRNSFILAHERVKNKRKSEKLAQFQESLKLSDQ